MARIKTTPLVRFALWALRIYLLILLVLIGLKFARTYSSSPPPRPMDSRPAAAAPAVTNQPAAGFKPDVLPPRRTTRFQAPEIPRPAGLRPGPTQINRCC